MESCPIGSSRSEALLSSTVSVRNIVFAEAGATPYEKVSPQRGFKVRPAADVRWKLFPIAVMTKDSGTPHFVLAEMFLAATILAVTLPCPGFGGCAPGGG